MVKKFFGLTLSMILVLSLFLLNSASTDNGIENTDELPVHIKEGYRVYIDDDSAYISASPHTLTSDGYVYLNVTSKILEGNIDFCFGFSNNLAYPKSLEVYDPKTMITQHELDLNPYFDNEDYNVQFHYNSTNKIGETVYDSYVIVKYKTKIFDEQNQTTGWQWTPVLSQNFDVAYLDSKIAYWNTTKTSLWTTIRSDLNFDKESFNFQDMDTWYLGNYVLEKNKEYYLRLWLTVVPTLDDTTYEFFVGLKQHGASMDFAVRNNQFYYLDPWYNDNWSYRRSHVIENASGAGTDYQVKITVHYTSGTDSGENVYLNGKCRSDFGDIRFTDNDKTTLLDYWMEDYDPGDDATFWVEVADDLSSANATIYVYYGNSGASSVSDGDDTFLFFDDFDGSTAARAMGT